MSAALRELTAALTPPAAWTLCLYILGSLSAYVLWKLFIYPDFMSPLADVPGPEYDSYLYGNMLKELVAESGFWHKRWTKQYGRIFQYRTWGGKHMVVVTDPKVMNYMLLTNPYAFPKPLDEAKGVERMLGRGLITSTDADHRRQRKIMAPAFSQTQIAGYAPIFQEQSDKLAVRIEGVLQDEVGESDNEGYTTLNISGWLSRATLDIIALAGFNYPLNTLDDPMHPLAVVLNRMLRPPNFTPFRLVIMRIIIILPDWVSELPLPVLKPFKESMKALHEAARDMLGDKLDAVDLKAGVEDGKGNKDFISQIIRANKLETSAKEKMRDDEVLGQVTTALIAGHETSSTALSWIFYVLSDHLQAQDKLRAEVQQAYSEAILRGETCPSHEQLAELPYLDAVVRETLRFIPPVFLTCREAMRSEVLPLSTPLRLRSGRIVTSLCVPAGTVFSIDMHVANRDVEVFGEDADEWRPERWIEKDGELKSVQRGYMAYSPVFTFLGGPRGCVAWKFAVQEVKTVLATLINRFEVREAGAPITKRSHIVARPIVEGKLSEGAQLPLKIRRVKDKIL